MRRMLSILVLMCSLVLSMSAQRCAVLEFKAGVGISQADVDGISAIFITYFRPAGYTMVERTQIDKAIDEQGFQRSKMTESQMVRIGEILNVSKIVVGDVNVVMGQYNVDVRVINVESGTIAATEGATFAGTSYRITMQSIAQKLAGKIAITSGGTMQSTSSQQTLQQRTEPYVIYGYLKVFPNDLGTFEDEPWKVIANINKQQQYGYGSWRLPTNEELQLMRANNVVGDYSYMTRENKRGIVRLVTDKDKGEISIEGFIDLGLPSRTLWKDDNEKCSNCEYKNQYTYDQAIEKYGNSLPTKEQWEELKSICTWKWQGRGIRITGPNGNSIYLPALGWVEKHYVGEHGYYWSSTRIDSSQAWNLSFSAEKIWFDDSYRYNPHGIRLVFNP